ncbi:MAG: hypothetical protein HW416_1152 [Chloroflexi bacterium]|nr:hypothetical protein [Chloroflexota bacterium]
MASPAATETGGAAARVPTPAGFHHVSVPVKDLKQAQRFFIDVMGGEFIFDAGGFAEVRCGGMVIGFSQADGGWTAPDAEFPHYAFLIDAEDMWPMKARLEANGVPTHAIWTRNGYTGLMYFRDPSGNLFELYCPRVRDEDAPKMVRRGQDGFAPPVGSLSYDWQR